MKNKYCLLRYRKNEEFGLLICKKIDEERVMKGEHELAVIKKRVLSSDCVELSKKMETVCKRMNDGKISEDKARNFIIRGY